MNTAQMITAITNSIQTDANMILLVRALFTNSLGTRQDFQLQNVCTILGIDYTTPPGP